MTASALRWRFGPVSGRAAAIHHDDPSLAFSNIPLGC